MFRLLGLVVVLFLATYANCEKDSPDVDALVTEATSADTHSRHGVTHASAASTASSSIHVSASYRCPWTVASHLRRSASLGRQSCRASSSASLWSCPGYQYEFYWRPISYKILHIQVHSRHFCCWLCKVIPSCGMWTWFSNTKYCVLYKKGYPIYIYYWPYAYGNIKRD